MQHQTVEQQRVAVRVELARRGARVGVKLEPRYRRRLHAPTVSNHNTYGEWVGSCSSCASNSGGVDKADSDAAGNARGYVSKL